MRHVGIHPLAAGIFIFEKKMRRFLLGERWENGNLTYARLQRSLMIF
jgi:hypothetical protein